MKLGTPQTGDGMSLQVVHFHRCLSGRDGRTLAGASKRG